MLAKDVICYDVAFTGSEWKAVDAYFTGYAGVDPGDIPPKYEEYILPNKETMMREARISLKACCVDVTGVDEQGIHLENGEIFNGPIIEKAYKDIEQCVLFVTSILNMKEIIDRQTDPLNEFFLDFWGVAMLAIAREQLQRRIDEDLKGTGYKRTSVWSPGQSRFDLINQKPLFRTLKPEDMGVILDKFNRMIPLKSVSGTIGILKEEAANDIISCDYCEYAKTCPGYLGKKFKNRENVHIG